eukprot:6854816-Pyramimonas_sp.AAC.1
MPGARADRARRERIYPGCEPMARVEREYMLRRRPLPLHQPGAAPTAFAQSSTVKHSLPVPVTARVRTPLRRLVKLSHKPSHKLSHKLSHKPSHKLSQKLSRNLSLGGVRPPGGGARGGAAHWTGLDWTDWTVPLLAAGGGVRPPGRGAGGGAARAGGVGPPPRAPAGGQRVLPR